MKWSRSPLAMLRRLTMPQHMIPPDRMLKNDFGGYSMYRIFITIAWPALCESILIGIITFVDTLMVSSVGEEAIAAVGLTTQPRLLFYAVLISFSIGVNSVTARRKGQENREGANRVMEQMLPLTVLAALLFFVISYLFSEPLLFFAGAKEDTIGYAVPYFRITMLGMIFSSVSLTLNAAQRGCGNTRISMTTNLAANLVNLVFNALLINGLLFFPKLGVTGAAIATAMGNFTAMVISILSVRKKNGYLRLRFRNLLRPRFDSLSPVSRVALGVMSEQIFMRFGFFLFAKLVAELGTIEFATHQIGMNILNLIFTIGDGLSIATSSLVGQSLGQKRPDRAMVYGKIAQRIGWCFVLAILISFPLLRNVIIRLFSDDPTVISLGSKIMLLSAFIAIGQIQQVLFAGCLRGAGDTKYMALVSMVSIAILRPLLSYILCYPLGFGLLGAWASILIDQYLRCIFSATRFFGQKWCKIEL